MSYASETNILKAIKNKLSALTNWVNAEDYSTSEVKTGKKWIDGKPIYRKTIDLGYMPSNTTGVAVYHGIPNIDVIVRLDGLFLWPDGTSAISPYIGSTVTLDSALFLTANRERITKFAGMDRHTIRAYATLKYTKTTDHVGGGSA